MFGNANFEDMLLLQIKYGKRNGAAFSDWIMKKRTLLWKIIRCLRIPVRTKLTIIRQN